MVLCDQTGDRNADAQKLCPIDLEFVKKSLETLRKRAVFRLDTGDKVKRDRLVGKLLQTQVCHNETQAASPDSDSDSKLRIRNDLQPLGPSPAGGPLLSGVLDETFGHEFIQILIQSWHADPATGGEHLLGTEFLSGIKCLIDFTAY